MISVKVFSREGGRPQPQRVVSIHGYKSRTDENGRANFEELKPGRYEVFVDGRRIDAGRPIAIAGCEIIYI